MNIDEFKKQFPDEDSCRNYFESVIWANGRQCPHCQCNKSYLLKSVQFGQALMNVHDVNDNLR